MSTSIRVAVYGGGLAGAILLHGLWDHPQLDVQAFTGDASFNEAGAAAISGLVRNGLNALKLMGREASQCFQRAGAIPLKGVRFMLAKGDKGEFIAQEDSPTDGTPTLAIVHTAVFVSELLASVPSEHLHPAKRLETIERKDDHGPIVLHFTDGTSHECDILVGVDGAQSTVRQFILGGDDSAASLRNTGAWAIIAQKTVTEDLKFFGDEFVEENRECSWVGDGVFFEHDLFNMKDGSQILNLIVASYDEGTESSDLRRRTVTSEELRGLFKAWPEPLRTAVEELLCDKSEQTAMYLCEHPPAHTYVSGPVCVVGDAAHAAAPWQGPSSGMMVEDALIISDLLGRATTRSEAITALRIYDEVRRPRTQRISETSKDTGIVLTGHGKDTGLDLEKLQQHLLPRWDFMANFDVEKHRAEAIRKMDSEMDRA